MHRCRFPNSGNRAMIFVRKIGFKLCVMRLNRVESFNAFTAITARRRGWPWLAARGNRLRPRPAARVRLATANPPCRGGRLLPRPPCKGAAGHLQGAAARRGNSSQGAATRGRSRLRPARKRLPMAHPQGVAASRGGSASRRGGRPLVGRLPAATRSAVAYAGAVATAAQEGTKTKMPLRI
ncbi:hypothetical protein GW17_00050341 [Ensete ventricosum]|uniref:Uncharacterized protein n=1 Tax=Ensete ventricosum TaxID=4639 RepID=A0A444CP48_ENSVE|nr:hypothetical protein GW17_00050341 [Ensete ventricosum]RZR74095.1 hypothetical protein BHM03_00032093 [Ensete ventricosum]